MKKGLFITLEGPDGCGKSTQAKLLARKLKAAGYPVRLTREPGGTPLAERLRSAILHSKFRISPLTELLLYEASRAQHTEEVIRPALAENKIVVSDRFTDATLAYQGYGRGIPLETVKALNEVATGGIKPDLTLHLAISRKAATERTAGRPKDRLERERSAFHARVRKGYDRIAKNESGRIKRVSGEGSVKEVGERIWAEVARKLGKRHV